MRDFPVSDLDPSTVTSVSYCHNELTLDIAGFMDPDTQASSEFNYIVFTINTSFT